MLPKPVIIIGGGICGLTLGRCLRYKGVPFILYEKSSNLPRHNYAITLNSSYLFQDFGIPEILGTDSQDFRAAIAVDRSHNGGKGRHSNSSTSQDIFQANRSAFETLLIASFQEKIVYSHKLTCVEAPTENSTEKTLIFNDHVKVTGDVIIDCTGVHSPLRSTLLPESKPTVLPYVAINGKRKIAYHIFTEYYSPFLGDGNCLETKVKGNGTESKDNDGTALSIKVNDYESDAVSITYTYSRPALTDGDDPLYLPNRPNSGAKNVPEAFFQEVELLFKASSMSPPFLDAFSPSKMRNDRLLHWLMRTMKVPRGDLEELSAKGFLLIGEAAYAEPIIGGRGASHAIKDAMRMAVAIDAWWRQGGHGNYDPFAEFYADRKRPLDVENSILRIREYHQVRQGRPVI